jgi:hypothetical protein
MECRPYSAKKNTNHRHSLNGAPCAHWRSSPLNNQGTAEHALRSRLRRLRKVGKVRLPFVLRKVRGGTILQQNISEYKLNIKIDEAKFNKPAMQ